MDGILVLGGLTMTILVIAAWQRTKRLDLETKELRLKLFDAIDRLRSLEEAEARRYAAARRAAADAEHARVEIARASAPPVTEPPIFMPPVAETPIAPSTPLATPTGSDVPVVAAHEAEVPVAAAHSAEVPVAVAPLDPRTLGPSDHAVPNPVFAWITGGNPVAKLGVVLMFFGLGYLLKFASEHGYLSIELRLSGAAAISMALLVVGWRLRKRMPVYGLTLQGGSIGALYLTSFAAFRFYSLLPHGLVFALLLIICAASVTLAVLQNAQSLALLASLGGYLAPILLSTGGGDPVALFSYYSLLSAGIIAISFWKYWRPVNLIGFGFTFAVAALWGVDQYDPSMYGAMQVLLAINIFMYGVLATLASLKREGTATDAAVDGTLVFGTPLVGFGLQVGLTQHWEYGPAFSALAFGAVYLPLARFTLRMWPEQARRLTLSFLALGGGFVTLAIPLALSARWTSMAWALEGLALLWVGRAQDRGRMIWSGTGLLGLAGASAWIAWTEGLDNPTFFMVGSTLAIVWLVAGWMWSREDLRKRFQMAPIFLTFGVIVWIGVLGGGSERMIPTGPGLVYSTMLALLGMSVTALIWTTAADKFTWRPLGECAFLVWPFAMLAFMARTTFWQHPFSSDWWSAVWIVALAVGAYLLRWGRKPGFDLLRATEHTTYVWWIFGLVLAEVWWRLRYVGWGAHEWQDAGLLTVASAVFLVLRQLTLRKHWSVTEFPRAYWVAGVLPALYVMAAFLFKANLLDGRSPGWPYIPVINPIELAAAFALLMGVVWHRELKRLFGPTMSMMHAVVLGGLVWWINGLLLRTLTTIGGVTWTPEAMWESAFLQTSMAIAWTVAALVCMAFAARRANREAWFVGAGALAVVVVKLFLVDSARGGGIARAVAFIGVAVLVLAIGYLAPLPPRERPEGEAVS